LSAAERKMAVTDPRRVFEDMRRARAQLAAVVTLRLRDEFGLPLDWLELLTVIAEVDGCRVHDLSTRLGMSDGGASKLVDRLEAAGYCRRLPNPADRRSSLLELTAAGQQTCARAGQAMKEELDRLLRTSLSTTQIREFAATLEDLRSLGP
jgi:MarR family transcriptional regulator, organic hydroperoxide resistance regulator